MTREQELEARVEQLEQQLNSLRSLARRRSVRRRSELTVLGLPLYDIALGPDFESGEVRGHARGVLAIGDIATGVFAFGGIARGLVAVGGVAVGGLAFGGLAIGLVAAFGGAALGTLAVGGAAAGFIAIGGGAAGYYAIGGGAIGEHVIDGVRQDPAVTDLLDKIVSSVKRLLGG